MCTPLGSLYSDIGHCGLRLTSLIVYEARLLICLAKVVIEEKLFYMLTKSKRILFFITTVFYIYFKVIFSIGSSASAQSDFTESKDAGIEPRTVASLTLASRCSNHLARSHPLSKFCLRQLISTCILLSCRSNYGQ
jgi:hypothetical protein